jgi:simple sugar transport system substrate-binding protein
VMLKNGAAFWMRNQQDRRKRSCRKAGPKIAMPIALVALLAVASGVLAGCGGSSSGTATADSGSTSSEKSLHFIYVTNNPSTEPNGAIIYNGMVAAAEELGVDAQYRATKTLETNPTETKRMLESAIAEKPDGLIISNIEPKALNATIKSATEQGIPTVIAQTGIGQAKTTGALTVVANDEVSTGRLGGEILTEEGGQHALVLSVPPALSPLVGEREQGFSEGFKGEITTLGVKEFSDITATTNALLAALQKDSSIDSVFGVGSALSSAELAAEKQLGSRSKEINWGTIDLGPQILEAIKEGEFSFGLDGQPYLQGYLPVLYLKQYIELGIQPVEELTPTGPEVVNAENVDQVLSLSEEKLR